MIEIVGALRVECVSAGTPVKVQGVDHPGLGTWNVTLLGGSSRRWWSHTDLSAQLGLCSGLSST